MTLCSTAGSRLLQALNHFSDQYGCAADGRQYRTLTPFATTDGDDEKYPMTFIPRKKGREGSDKVCASVHISLLKAQQAS